MSVAGIWDTWHRGTSDERCSFSILTTAANSFMSEIHDRMPVILARIDEDAWLDPEIHEQEELHMGISRAPKQYH
jgi:putative SOS response-associated peptidase YedK